jgi:uncharacterized protein (DUF1800 family)
LSLLLSLSACPVLDAGIAPRGRVEAWRFLTQATFGPTEADVQHVTDIGYEAWINEQLQLGPAITYKAYFDARSLAMAANGRQSNPEQVIEAFYTRALTDPSQLRHRLSLALSEIMVVSFADEFIGAHAALVASYLDTLDAGLNETYESLLMRVATSPAMAQYLSFRGNIKEDPSIGRTPDENFAREVMQLFTIGLYELNLDGTPKLDAQGKPIETYTADDVRGLAKVFTGWSFDFGPSFAAAGEGDCFFWLTTCRDLAAYTQPLRAYPVYHSVSEKSFLGVTVPAQGTPDMRGDLTVAIRRLANHPNTAPFISRQLIQRLVTSNPSTDYVRRVATVFQSTGGNVAAVAKAILMDDEARLLSPGTDPDAGKVREPILRLTALLRAFKISSTALAGGLPYAPIPVTNDLATSLGQTPFFSPSVFNFFRPGYVKPHTVAAARGLVAPETQLVTETSVSSYVNVLQDLLDNGMGNATATFNERVRFDFADQRPLASAPDQLAQLVIDRLLGGKASDALRQQIVQVVSTMRVPDLDPSQSNLLAVNAALDQRTKAAVLLVAVSPEFIVQP